MWHETKIMRDSLRVVAHDAFPADGGALPADFVMGIGGASRTLLELTPTRRVGRALDLGCGSGVQSLFLNAERIVATDIDPRALAAAERSFHLSGFRRIDDRTWREGERLITLQQGSLFEPVGDQRFDLVVSNPPFVIAGAGHVHRDSPFDGDGLSQTILRELPRHLNPDGVAIVLLSWLQLRGETWQDRVGSWIPSGVGAWVAQREFLNIDEYVEVWGTDAGLPAAERSAWRERLLSLNAEGIGFGWVALQHSNTAWLHIEDVSMATRVPTGEELLEQLRASASPITAVDALFGTWMFEPQHWRGDLALDVFGAGLLTEIRAGSTLEEAIDTVATRLPVDPDDLRVVGLALVLELVRLGYLRRTSVPEGI